MSGTNLMSSNPSHEPRFGVSHMMFSTRQSHLEKIADAELISTWHSHLEKSAEAELECWRLQIMMMRLYQQQYISSFVAESGVLRLALTKEMSQRLADKEVEVTQSLAEEEIEVVSLSLTDKEIEEVSHSLENEEIDVVSPSLMDEDVNKGNRGITWQPHSEKSADAAFEFWRSQTMVMMCFYQHQYNRCYVAESGVRRLAFTDEVSQSMADEKSEVAQSLTEEEIEVVSLSSSDEEIDEVSHSVVGKRMIEVVSPSLVHNEIEEGHERINNKRPQDSFVQCACCVRCKWVCSEPFVACLCNDPLVILVPSTDITKRVPKVKNGCVRCDYRGSCVHFSTGRYDVLVGGALCFCSRTCRRIWFAEQGGMIIAKKRVRAWSLA